MHDYLRRFRVPRFEIQDHAPASYLDLNACSVGILKVWSGASDNTIWGAPHSNALFRAWHDSLHLRHGLGFDPSHELILAEFQIKEAARVIGDRFALLVKAEVQGQIEFFKEFNKFPENQLEFTLNYMREHE